MTSKVKKTVLRHASHFSYMRHFINVSLLEPQNVRNLSHPVRIRWIKLSNLAIFIYITGYLDVRKMSETLVFRTFVGALIRSFGEVCLSRLQRVN